MNEKTKADRRKEEAFVRGETDKADDEEPKPPKRKAEPRQKPKEKLVGEEQAPATPPPPVAELVGRMPLSTRIRSDFGRALKRASLERQLSGEKPNTVQDILEEALEPWLKDRGYLK